MNERTDPISALSDALAARTEDARGSVVAIRGRHGSLSAIVWRDNCVVTSAQSLPKRDSYEVVGATGEAEAATLAGADDATNIAVLRLGKPQAARPFTAHMPKAGELVLAFGADRGGEIRARLGLVSGSGDAWVSSKGGKIDRRIALDLSLSRREEGGPVFAAKGGLIGMSTFGPMRRVIVIPTATLERVVPVLLADGRVPRGWLGLALQPVAVPETFRNGQTAALMAMSVASGGPAEKAGLLAGDIVLSVGGQSTQRFRDVTGFLGADSIGRTIEIRFVRGGAIQTLNLTVEAQPTE